MVPWKRKYIKNWTHLWEHKFKHNFQDVLNPLCNCGMDVESSTHFFLLCLLYVNERCTLISSMNRINPQISQTSLQLLTNTLRFGNWSYSDKTNTHILNAAINYIRLSKRFDESLFWMIRFFSFLIYISDKFTNLYRYKFQHNFF